MGAGLSICAVLLLQLPAFAGEEASEGGWAPPSAGPVTTWTAPMVGKGKLAVQPFAIYTHTRGSFNDDGHSDSLTANSEKVRKSLFQEQIFSQYGITDKWEIDAQTVYQESYVTQDGAKAHANGFGDSFLFTRYELVEEKGWVPEATGLLQIKVPTGKYQHGDPDKLGADIMGAGSWDPGVGINLTKTLKPFIIHADAVMSFPQEVRIDGTKTQYGNYLNYDAAVEYFLPKGFNLMLEANALYQGNAKLDGEKDPASDVRSLTLSPGIGWSNDRIQTLVAYQRTVSGRNTDANDAVVATFVYTF
jgi:hypothetical protein